MTIKNNRFAILAAAFLAVTSPASAGDGYLNSNTGLSEWQGLYIGAQAGYASLEASGLDVNGAAIGGYLGYRIKTSGVVIGIEADVNGTTLEQSSSSSFGLVTMTTTAHLDTISSIRATLGAVAGPVLIYGTAGAAYATGNFAATVSGFGIKVSAGQDFSTTGYVIGGGIEKRLSSNMTGRIEGLYYGLSEIEAAGVSAKIDASVMMIKAGIAWQLN